MPSLDLTRQRAVGGFDDEATAESGDDLPGERV
jgi:hypothetical protein